MVYHRKVLLKRFHLNGHSIGFRQQTQNMQAHYTEEYRFDKFSYEESKVLKIGKLSSRKINRLFDAWQIIQADIYF